MEQLPIRSDLNEMNIVSILHVSSMLHLRKVWCSRKSCTECKYSHCT